MNSLKRVKEEMKEPIKFTLNPDLKKPSLIVGWTEDAGKIAPLVIQFLNQKLECQSFCQINPLDFFPLNGVEIKDNVAYLPTSKFYNGFRKDVVIFLSDFPHYNRYRFLNIILDVAENFCKAKEIYTISGLTSIIPHTVPRRIFAVYNESEFQDKLRDNGLNNITYEGPPHLNSYLLWVAKRRGLKGVSLWPQTSFYLAPCGDPYAVRITLSFFRRKFNLDIDLSEWDEQIRRQHQLLSQLRSRNPEIHSLIDRLEKGLSLTGEEEMKLVEDIPRFLQKDLKKISNRRET